jgi:hypothetical protein
MILFSKIFKKIQNAGNPESVIVEELDEYIGRMLKKGFKEEIIKDLFFEKGWPEKNKISEIYSQQIRALSGKTEADQNVPDGTKKKSGGTNKKIKGVSGVSKKISPKHVKKIRESIIYERKKEVSEITAITDESTRIFLADVPENKYFWMNNGPVIKNIIELCSALKDIDETTFTHHVNKEKNDFSTWVRDAIGDKTLASNLTVSDSRKSMIRELKDRIAVCRRNK